MDTTLRELINRLEEMAGDVGDDAPVRIAIQESYPLQEHIGRDIGLRTDNAGTRAVYIIGTGQVHDAPYAPRELWTEPVEELSCDACETTNVTADELKANEGICNTCRLKPPPPMVPAATTCT